MLKTHLGIKMVSVVLVAFAAMFVLEVDLKVVKKIKYAIILSLPISFPTQLFLSLQRTPSLSPPSRRPTLSPARRPTTPPWCAPLSSALSYHTISLPSLSTMTPPHPLTTIGLCPS